MTFYITDRFLFFLAIVQWMRENIGTTWHSMSTNPMKAREIGGVVDARLNVYGTSNLKVAGE